VRILRSAIIHVIYTALANLRLLVRGTCCGGDSAGNCGAQQDILHTAASAIRMHHTPRCVAVVGGGSAGACAVAALAGVGSPPIHVLWYDRAPEWVRTADEHGLAASTGHPFTGGALSTYVTFYSAAPLPHHT
jgi:hypothetical protein